MGTQHMITQGKINLGMITQDKAIQGNIILGDIIHYTIPMNDIFNLNSTILPENLEVFYSTLPCQP